MKSSVAIDGQYLFGIFCVGVRVASAIYLKLEMLEMFSE